MQNESQFYLCEQLVSDFTRTDKFDIAFVLRVTFPFGITWTEAEQIGHVAHGFSWTGSQHALFRTEVFLRW